MQVLFSYIIADYEHSNFSVSQSRVVDNGSVSLVSIESPESERSNIAPSPSARSESPSLSSSPPARSEPPNVAPSPPALAKPTMGSSHRHRDIIIGTSIGVIAVLSLCILVATLTIRRSRHRNKQQEKPQQPRNTSNEEAFAEPRASIGTSAREIGNNSAMGHFREMPDSGLVELLDGECLTCNESHTLRAPTSSPPGADEIDSRRNAHEMLRTEAVPARQSHHSASAPRENWVNRRFSADTSCVQSVVQKPALAEEVGLEVASVASSSLEAVIYFPYTRKPLDLNRSLSSTPITKNP